MVTRTVRVNFTDGTWAVGTITDADTEHIARQLVANEAMVFAFDDGRDVIALKDKIANVVIWDGDES